MELWARRYDTGDAARFAWQGDRLDSVQPAATSPPPSTAEMPWIAPGLIDIQVNGYGGQEFSSADLLPEQVAEIVRRHWDFGVTQLCPTLTTQSREVFLSALAAIDRACRNWADVDHSVAGVHLEGPYLSAEDGPRGAHPAEHCRPPNWDEFQRFQDAAGGRVRLVTLSPEYAEAPAFIRRATATGVVVALGHLNATGEQIRAAADAGARLSTHLGNGAHRVLRRHPNYLWDQLAEDRLWASLIVDGHHLPPEVVQTFIRAKGPERCLIVSDVSGLAGLPPGRYGSSGCELEILPDGRLVIAGQDQLLAGASRPLGVGVALVQRYAGLSPAAAFELASHQPARLLGRPVVRLEAGEPADWVIFRWAQEATSQASTGLDVLGTIVGGAIRYRRPELEGWLTVA